MKRKYSKKKSAVSGGSGTDKGPYVRSRLDDTVYDPNSRVSESSNDIKKAISFSETPQIKEVPKLEYDIIVGESPSLELIELLVKEGANIDYFDPHVDTIPNIRKHPKLTGKKSVEWNEQTIREFDLILISTAHNSVNYQELGEWAKVVVDTRNAMSKVSSPKAKIFLA